jgi:hypothetical protein
MFNNADNKRLAFIFEHILRIARDDKRKPTLVELTEILQSSSLISKGLEVTMLVSWVNELEKVRSHPAIIPYRQAALEKLAASGVPLVLVEQVIECLLSGKAVLDLSQISLVEDETPKAQEPSNTTGKTIKGDEAQLEEPLANQPPSFEPGQAPAEEKVIILPWSEADGHPPQTGGDPDSPLDKLPEEANPLDGGEGTQETGVSIDFPEEVQNPLDNRKQISGSAPDERPARLPIKNSLPTKPQKKRRWMCCGIFVVLVVLVLAVGFGILVLLQLTSTPSTVMVVNTATYVPYYSPDLTLTAIYNNPTSPPLLTKTATPPQSIPTRAPENSATPVPDSLATPAPPPGEPKAQVDVEISSRIQWVASGLTASQGDKVFIQYLSGQWTVDPRGFSYVDANGYPDQRPVDYCSWCDAPIMDGVLGQLVARVSGARDVFPIGNYGEFIAPIDGPIILAINDMYESYDDDQGSVVVRVSVFTP